MKILEVDKMNKTERLQAMEELWDSFLREDNELESPPWHQDILEKRSQKIEENEAEFIPLEALRKGRKP